MKLSRRKMFGTMVGGAVAAPEVAKQAINSVMNHGSTSERIGGIGPSTMEFSGIDKASQTISHAQYMANRKTELLKILNGEFNEWHREELELLHRLQDKRHIEIQNLKSVSETHKRLMDIDHNRKVMIENWKSKARKELDALAKGLFL